MRLARARLRAAGVDAPRGGADGFAGIGDDGALSRGENGEWLIYTMDALVDGVHFRLDEIAPDELGWKAVAVNQSDVAAMGGEPEFALMTLGGLRFEDGDWARRFYGGVGAALREFGGVCVGGDTVASGTAFVVVMMTGRIAAAGVGGRGAGAGGGNGEPLRRDAARVGDQIGVTGALGGAAGWLDGRIAALRARHFKPQPRIAAGGVLRAAGVRCAMDLSDGLTTDLPRILAASDVAATVRIGDVPIDGALVANAARLCSAPFDLALSGGEDYELLFTCPPDIMAAVLKALPDARRIGEIEAARRDGDAALRLADADGAVVAAPRGGWDNLNRTASQ